MIFISSETPLIGTAQRRRCLNKCHQLTLFNMTSRFYNKLLIIIKKKCKSWNGVSWPASLESEHHDLGGGSVPILEKISPVFCPPSLSPSLPLVLTRRSPCSPSPVSLCGLEVAMPSGECPACSRDARLAQESVVCPWISPAGA